MIWLVVTAWALPAAIGQATQVERLEIQTVLREDGTPGFVQAVTWRWHEQRYPGDLASGWMVAEWEMIIGEPRVHQRDGRYQVRYRTATNERYIETRNYKRSAGHIDVEAENRKVFDEQWRVKYFD